MVFRVYVEKKKELAHEAAALLNEFRNLLGIEALMDLRIINRYDVEGIDRELFDYAVKTVFSEPQVDVVYENLDIKDPDAVVFAVEYLPGQFDQRADSAAQCIQIISQGERPEVRSARVYVLYGRLSEGDIGAIKKYLINPVEAREASLEKPETLMVEYELPESVAILYGFCRLDKAGLEDFIREYGLAMDADDIAFLQQYFIKEGRDPTVTEIRMIDTYWSDHCRHTTFLTAIDNVTFEDPAIERTYNEYLKLRELAGSKKPVCLMDLATIAARYLKKTGRLDQLDESEEVNACTVKIDVEVDGKIEPWLLLFKNETHNHPTEIEPFGGAATCIGGAIRDPLSGRAYVYAAMRVTGAADPTRPVSETLPGKLPQRKIVTSAAAGYSSYGNQIGIATGIVDELYHEGYVAKRLEIGAVIGAAPAGNVRRERPAPGDVVILLGGRTGRDGCGGATGSSKSHTKASLTTCGAEVQKGNPPEERKLQRLFRNQKAARMIKKCNDFGAGGVSVAIGELADGLDIDLDRVPKKYEGLDGTELAISESQERMAVVIAPENVSRFLELAEEENLEATVVARVKADPRLTMRWNGKTIVDVSREFLNSNGAPKHTTVAVTTPQPYDRPKVDDFASGMKALMSDLNVCSKQGLSERFDSTIGAGTVLMPFGGRYQATPIQAMVHKISVEQGHTDDCSLMSWGFNPFISERSPYHGAYLAVVESISKLIATGAEFKDIFLTFQEYFEKPGQNPARWGKPLAALLGALRAQVELGVASVGGKDSMSGSFENLDVPPTLVSFAVTTEKTKNIRSPEFKKAGSRVVLIKPELNADRLPDSKSLIDVFEKVRELLSTGKAISAWTLTYGGIAEGIFKMCLGNRLGFVFDENLSLDDIFGYNYGAFLLELADNSVDAGTTVGYITDEQIISYNNDKLLLCELESIYSSRLEGVFPRRVAQGGGEIPTLEYRGGVRVKYTGAAVAAPRVVIPVFPGTNCEYDTAKMLRDAGAEVEIFVINNLTPAGIARSIERFAALVRSAQMIVLPGGFSGGDEPDGSGKFITAFFRNAAVKEAVEELIEKRRGLICGICNGFQALIKLGLVPYGRIIDPDENSPTLTYNIIGRHQSRLVRTRVVSNKSPWLAATRPGDIFTVPISHGEGRFYAPDDVITELAENGQIATQYVDLEGRATYDIEYNPNGSTWAIEGITSPDGRILGKMGHVERNAQGLYINVPGVYDMKMFESAVQYFKKEI
ncbi:MAG: phosphoribosylformylglycinamidine synthase [Clostridiales bacterium]|nr:phosphoribosylformylglycinamidine synthase [Clostridiales bacterium]